MSKAFRLPLPPSHNALTRAALMGPIRCKSCNSMHVERPGIRLYPTREAEDFKEAAQRRLPRQMITGPVEVRFTVYVDTLQSDGPNREKALFDALQGFLYDNDCQIAEWHGVKAFADKYHPAGVVIEVLPADVQQHAEMARRLSKSVIQERANRAAQPALSLTSNDAPKTGSVAKQVVPRNVPGESPLQRINRLATPATYPAPKPEDPEAA